MYAIAYPHSQPWYSPSQPYFKTAYATTFHQSTCSGFRCVLLLLVEVYGHTSMDINGCYIILHRRYFQHLEYNVPEEEVNEGLI
jgi:hypothetical protein